MREVFPDLYKLSCDYGEETKKVILRETEKRRKVFQTNGENIFLEKRTMFLDKIHRISRKLQGKNMGSMYLQEFKIQNKKKLRESLQINIPKIAEYCTASQSR